MENEVKIESKLGFDKLRDSVSRNCSTLYAKEMASEEKISTVAEEVSRRLVLVDEFRQIMMFEPSFPDSPFVDCIPFLIPLKSEYAYIDLASLARLRDALDLLRRILSFFSNCKEEKYPNLKKLSAPVISFPEVSRRIDTILDKYGNVRDNASEELYAIRRSIREKEGIASRRIQAILKKAQQDGIADSEAQVSVRDGKLLIPVSSGNKRKVPGLVYDESSSGKTSFVEPLEVVEINNQVRELHFEEQREIIRILTQFTEFLRPYIDDIVESGEFMGLLDFIRAKAIVCARFQGGMPILSVNGEVILKKARHPLLEEALKKEGKAIVPLDITLTSEKRILLISGPNAGGKSVCLKTVGLLQYMMQWGLLIPAAESSELSIFKSFFVDIGDDQSLENDLSTYSSHLMNMKEVVEGADSKSLVLIDEFGSGTE
ncbi:MAG: endonuclease MutS2, partial [Bacteroidales bacterium]|nr:endonuclease MutS2 [Bacteroidales bacterium]